MVVVMMLGCKKPRANSGHGEQKIDGREVTAHLVLISLDYS